MIRDAKRWMAPVVCALSVAWLGYEIFQRVVPPGRFDEKGRVAEMFERDPKVGTEFPIPAPDAQARTAFVWMGDCNQCTAKALPVDRLKAACPKGLSLVLLTSDTPRDPYRKSGLSTVPLSVEDKNRINAFFAPRVYIVSGGRLERLQSRNDDPLEVLQG